MTVNSFLLKGWSVTLISALFAFATRDTNISYIIITYVSTPLFWIIDGFYLSQERQYRSLYDFIRKRNEDEIDFDLNAKPYAKGRNNWMNSIFSKILALFYGSLIGITLIVMFLIN